VRIVGEYPAIAELIARKMRLRQYRIFPVVGAPEAYPPEDADVALLAASGEAQIEGAALRPIARVLSASACLIANRRSVATKDLSRVLGGLLAAGRTPSPQEISVPSSLPMRTAEAREERTVVRIALPDGHAQQHTVAALKCAGIEVEGYDETSSVRRPRVKADGVEAKVIRPQDMPQQVAIGNFDLAVTGRDVLFDHLVQFPSSPVEEIVDLKRSKYSLAVIVKDVRADSVAGAVREWRDAGVRTIRVASEYANIADHFARERHFGRYSVIPIAGASEGFVPDDAEILIEGIETGSSVKANKLTVLERFFESTNCVIANKRPVEGARRAAFERIVEQLRSSAAEPAAVGA
jgi:ATP phosphoribosyltransferase